PKPVNREHLFTVLQQQLSQKRTKLEKKGKEQADFFRKHDQKAVAAGRALVNEEWVTLAADGARILLETTKSPLFYDDGVVAGVLGVGHDITERYEAAEKEQAASRAKSVFLSSISHELRTPLNAILGYTQVLPGDGMLTDKQRNGIRTIHRAGEHLLLLINDILDISKIESGKLEIVETEVHPVSFFHTIKEIIELRAKEKGLELRYLVEGDLPSAVLVDGLRLRQILLNLLSNAVKFTESGHCAFLIQGERREDERLRLTCTVEDSGPGIEEEYQEVIFEPFRQVGDRLHHGEGTGLGLSISCRLVMLMGGELQLVSPVNKEQAGCEGAGSRFSFTLEVPILQNEIFSSPDPHRQRVSGYTCTAPEEADRQQSILVVDDVPSNRAVLRDILEAVGFIVQEAEDGKNILKTCQENQPDLILMDLLMPGTDGLTAGQKIRQNKKFDHIPIIAVSALV
ncbi:MAG: response regulator, partial [Candidatus Electrothrix sp. EH2]|nr:response regulator [Candidatus Electrothrix sp. EH2]